MTKAKARNIVLVLVIGVVIGICTALMADPWIPVTCASWAIWGASLGIAVARDA